MGLRAASRFAGFAVAMTAGLVLGVQGGLWTPLGLVLISVSSLFLQNQPKLRQRYLGPLSKKELLLMVAALLVVIGFPVVCWLSGWSPRSVAVPDWARVSLPVALWIAIMAGGWIQARRAWGQEAEDRINAYDAGILKASSAEAVLKQINR